MRGNDDPIVSVLTYNTNWYERNMA